MSLKAVLPDAEEGNTRQDRLINSAYGEVHWSQLNEFDSQWHIVEAKPQRNHFKPYIDYIEKCEHYMKYGCIAPPKPQKVINNIYDYACHYKICCECLPVTQNEDIGDTEPIPLYDKVDGCIPLGGVNSAYGYAIQNDNRIIQCAASPTEWSLRHCMRNEKMPLRHGLTKDMHVQITDNRGQPVSLGKPRPVITI